MGDTDRVEQDPQLRAAVEPLKRQFSDIDDEVIEQRTTQAWDDLADAKITGFNGNLARNRVGDELREIRKQRGDQDPVRSDGGGSDTADQQFAGGEQPPP